MYKFTELTENLERYNVPAQCQNDVFFLWEVEDDEVIRDCGLPALFYTSYAQRAPRATKLDVAIHKRHHDVGTQHPGGVM